LKVLATEWWRSSGSRNFYPLSFHHFMHRTSSRKRDVETQQRRKWHHKEACKNTSARRSHEGAKLFKS